MQREIATHEERAARYGRLARRAIKTRRRIQLVRALARCAARHALWQERSFPRHSFPVEVGGD